MAALIPAVTLLTVTTLACLVCGASTGTLVGSKTEITDVKKNKEVQDLGYFSVEEHNRRLRQALKGMAEEAKFVEVVEAQKQVVAGTKYYLKISATQGGRSVMFDTVVVVQPGLASKVLLSFAPSSQKIP
ncbi:cysteine proteinase inhibitor B [Vigna radiata var. radiata]|uniref:Cysteine proteinase inhibitor B n=1 Tax=Vigna radiata var. radiata TaxID=3916 RepID=A0A1S3UQC6_VIGRR|nr:cysteine proteinase inhibitor B [Vigna radiata var. radiata]